ncbi:MAG TPA: dihydroxyacetone kinase subunit DhaL [Terriglobales bacterium]|nr:dihydroxyacetone kinase subunit DhaL [Terriglobales bacterium]
MEQFTLDQARSWIQAAALAMERNATMLSDLDGPIGDGDHGFNMARGFTAIRNKLESTAVSDLGALFKLVGMTLLSTVGGAAGPLYGGFFLELGRCTAGKTTIGKAELGETLTRGLADIQRRGKAELGDKTMVDAMAPAFEKLRSAPNGDIGTALQSMEEAAKTAAEATSPMLARKGRASYLGERSIGHQDPGATSSWLLLQALASACKAS